MANKILVQALDGTPKQIVFADHAGDFSPTTANDLRITTDASFETDVQLTLASLADGAARQSAKFDFGEKRAPAYSIKMAIELASSGLTAGEVIELYMGFSDHATAGNGNPAGLSGSDAAYTGYSSNLAASIKQLELIGTATVTAQATPTVQVIDKIGTFSPKGRYGILVPKNESGAAVHSDDVECHIVLNPEIPEIQ